MKTLIKCPYCITTENITNKSSKFILVHKNKNLVVCLNCQSTFSFEKLEKSSKCLKENKTSKIRANNEEI